MRPRAARTQKVARELLEFYDGYDENGRLAAYAGQLEFYRTKEIILRHLRKRRAVILDIGGGPGRYWHWLTKLGHSAHLVDFVPRHIEQALAALAQSRKRLASARVGDARKLEFGDNFADAVLLLGPLYHLTKRSDRLAALREARRTLKPGGCLFAAGISRFASSFDGFLRDFLRDPKFFRIVQRDLKDGQHRNISNNPQYFTTTFFHHPDELRGEVQEAGFSGTQLFALEGPGWVVSDFEKYWRNAKLRARLLSVVRAVETEPSLIGLSAHILAVARKR